MLIRLNFSGSGFACGCVRLLSSCCAALALAACARQAPRYAAAPRSACSELDVRMYGAPQPASYAVRRVAQVVPVAATFEDGPYTLDSGDKLRIVVFGQDALSNNYTVDAQGAVTLPLVGAVEARGLTTAQLGGAIAGAAEVRLSSATRASRSRSKPTGRSSCSARSPSRASTPTCRT